MSDIDLYKKFVELPDELKQEADDFVDYLQSKMKKKHKSKSRKAGLAKGLIEMSDDFEQPLDDFQEYQQ